MGNYMTRADLEDRFEDSAEVASLTDSSPTPDTAVEDDCIEAAEAEIDTRIGQRYATPVVVAGNASLTAILKRKATDIAEYFLYSRGGFIPEPQVRRYDAVIVWADGIAEGKYALPGAVTPPSTTSREPRAEWSSSNRTHDADDARKFTRLLIAGL